MTLHTTLGTVRACSDPQRTREAPELTLSTPWTDPTRIPCPKVKIPHPRPNSPAPHSRENMQHCLGGAPQGLGVLGEDDEYRKVTQIVNPFLFSSW